MNRTTTCTGELSLNRCFSRTDCRSCRESQSGAGCEGSHDTSRTTSPSFLHYINATQVPISKDSSPCAISSWISFVFVLRRRRLPDLARKQLGRASARLPLICRFRKRFRVWSLGQISLETFNLLFEQVNLLLQFAILVLDQLNHDVPLLLADSEELYHVLQPFDMLVLELHLVLEILSVGNHLDDFLV
jgi:hypothetical protein